MQEQQYQLNSAVAEQREVSGVLRNTYGLLALTLAFSGLVAYVSQQMRLPYPNVFVVLIGFYGLFFLTVKLRNSAWGLVSTFALTASWATRSARSSTCTSACPTAAASSLRRSP